MERVANSSTVNERTMFLEDPNQIRKSIFMLSFIFIFQLIFVFLQHIFTLITERNLWHLLGEKTAEKMIAVHHCR